MGHSLGSTAPLQRVSPSGWGCASLPPECKTAHAEAQQKCALSRCQQTLDAAHAVLQSMLCMICYSMCWQEQLQAYAWCFQVSGSALAE
jgi:hypothetical protein